MENNDDERLNYYISIGAIEVAGIDADVEFLFEITERAREVAPELWQAHEQHVDQSLLRMFEMGLVDVTYDENLEAHLELSPEGKKRAKEFGIIEMDRKDLPND